MDSDTPNDPKIKAILDAAKIAGGRAAAAQTFGHIALLWCYIANHGEGVPGDGVTLTGTPLSPREMANECLFETQADLATFLDTLAREGLIEPARWQAAQIVFLPGMLKRADTYAKRKGRPADPCSNMFEHKPRKGPIQDNTIQDTKDQPRRGPTGPSPADLLSGPGQVEALVTLWNETRTHGPAVRDITTQRRSAILRALRDRPNLADWGAVIRWIDGQGWCNAPGTGDHPNWRATLDFIIKPGKLAQYLERAAADRPRLAADGSEGRNAARGRTGFRRGEFAAALKGT